MTSICVSLKWWMVPAMWLETTFNWRHNDLFRRRSKKTSKVRVTGLCVGNSLGPVNSPHKVPVKREMFPFDDVIMDTICVVCLTFLVTNVTWHIEAETKWPFLRRHFKCISLNEQVWISNFFFFFLNLACDTGAIFHYPGEDELMMSCCCGQ